MLRMNIRLADSQLCEKNSYIYRTTLTRRTQRCKGFVCYCNNSVIHRCLTSALMVLTAPIKPGSHRHRIGWGNKNQQSSKFCSNRPDTGSSLHFCVLAAKIRPFRTEFRTLLAYVGPFYLVAVCTGLNPADAASPHRNLDI